MARAFASPRHEALRVFLKGKRKSVKLRQVDVAKKLKRGQDYVSTLERGQKIVDVIELMEWAEAVGFDPCEAIRHLSKTPRK
jgi:transcriptional regulator with XRE-family HTH domain